jgi:hypothetical protein
MRLRRRISHEVSVVVRAPDATKGDVPVISPSAAIEDPSGVVGACQPGVPRHLEPYAVEVDQWRREALAAREARRSRPVP